jgi:DNA modification methylase
MQYESFLDTKKIVAIPTGLSDLPPLNNTMFDFQKDIVKWAMRRGRAAIFADCGLGKTFMQLEWAKAIGGNVLILAPLAVAQQTVEEGAKFGISVKYCRSQDDVGNGITITNYEMLHHFEHDFFNGVVLDESSILKAFDGKTRNMIIDRFKHTPFKLACTATPAPNDYMELGNHSEFLGIMSVQEMLATYFVHDGGETQKWRLKGHAQDDFWQWITSWAVNIRRPSDLGYPDDGYALPELIIHEHIVDGGDISEGMLFPMQAATLQERIQARRESVPQRSEKVAEIVSTKPNEQWLIWCNLNNESESAVKLIDGAKEIRGSHTVEYKQKTMLDFTHGGLRILVSKPSISGYGMNWQNCNNVVFLGLSDSYEDFYQAVRRCWRFGQKKPVNVHVVIARTEGAVVANIKRKNDDADKMTMEMVKYMSRIQSDEIHASTRETLEYKTCIQSGNGWEMRLGDCVEHIKTLADESIHYSIFSPPFASLYTYSNSDRDMGNCRSDEEFMTHFSFLVKELFRVLKTGRLVSFHCMNMPTSKARDGVIGIRDFRGELIRLFQSHGFTFHSEVCIWKDPVTAMQRTKALGLLHKQIKKDSCMSRQGIPDYLVTMRKDGVNSEPVTHTNETFPVQVWQRYASPIWMDINPSDTLQYRSAREHNDERHICPLQLQVIARGLDLWTNPNDLVLSPFGGIGSEGYQALKQGRRFIGFELKESYFNQACKNLASVQNESAPLLALAGT